MSFTKAQLLQILIGVPDDAVIHGMNEEFGESYPPSHVTYDPEHKRVILEETPVIADSTPAKIVLWAHDIGQCCCACDCAKLAAAKLNLWTNEGPLTRQEAQAILGHGQLTRDEASDNTWID
jgi:hypothetical protein